MNSGERTVPGRETRKRRGRVEGLSSVMSVEKQEMRVAGDEGQWERGWRRWVGAPSGRGRD